MTEESKNSGAQSRSRSKLGALFEKSKEKLQKTTQNVSQMINPFNGLAQN